MSKSKSTTTSRSSRTFKLDRTPRPRILVLERFGAAERAVARSGGIPITVSPHNIEDVLSALEAGMFDGLLLTGGGDVDPRLYGARPHKEVYGVSETRDELEWLALDTALDMNVPVMGICRGTQLMAVHNGGKLKQHITGHRGGTHLVITEPGSVARSSTGHIKLKCVSLHHQEILDPGKGFKITGRAIDRTVEIIESDDERCIGYQYHPEMDYGVNAASRFAFDWLVDKACERIGIDFPGTPYRKPVAPRETTYQSRKPKPKNRQAGTRTQPQPQLPKRAKSSQKKFDSSVAVSWLCPHCALRFDDHDDREMHIAMIHGMPTVNDDREWQARSEPPARHPDWEDERPAPAVA